MCDLDWVSYDPTWTFVDLARAKMSGCPGLDGWDDDTFSSLLWECTCFPFGGLSDIEQHHDEARQMLVDGLNPWEECRRMDDESLARHEAARMSRDGCMVRRMTPGRG